MKGQRASVMVITLWTITLLTILITVIAGRIRLSSQAAFFHQEELQDWASVVAAVNQAEMELMLERMPRPLQADEDPNEASRNPLFRFNGRELALHYAQAEGITVRIYDHAGKINLRELSRPRMRALLEKKLGEDADEQIDELIAAWGDWVDLNEIAAANGAEEDYYAELDTPYIPRNGRLETVEEMLHIRGFAEAFAGVDLDAAFTLYTDEEQINLNLATVETMELLPGLDAELIREIVTWRADNEFRGNGDIAQLLPAENMAELRPWIDSRTTSNYYTVMAYRADREMSTDESLGAGEDGEPVELDVSATAFAEIVEVRTAVDRPRVMKVNPYQRIPARIAVLTEEGVVQ